MPKLLPPAVDTELAQGRFSQALLAIEATIKAAGTGDNSPLGLYCSLLQRKIAALPRIDIEHPAGEAAPPANPAAPWLENEKAWILLHYRPAEALGRFRHLRRLAHARLDAGLGEVEALRSLQRLTEAHSVADDLGSVHGSHPDWKIAAARLHVEEGRIPAALDRLDQVIGVTPHHEGAIFEKAMCLRGAERRQEAQSILTDHQACCEASVLRQLAQGWLHFDHGDWDSALHEFGDVLGRGYRHPAALVGKIRVLRTRRTAEDLREARELLSPAGPGRTDPDLAIQAGWLAFESSEYEDAVDIFDRALDACPYEPNAVVGKVEALKRRGRRRDAEQILQAAATTVPESRRFKHELGWFYLNNGEYARAAEYFSAIRKEHREDARAAQGLATAYHYSGRYDDAEQLLRESLAFAPEDAALRNAFGWILILCGHYSDAIAEFDAALAVDKAFEGAVQGKFTALSRLEKYGDIRTLLAEFECVRHESVALHIMRGQAAFAQGSYDQALEEFQQTLARHDDHIDALVGRIATLRTLGRFGESQAAHTAALRVAPGDTRLLIEEAWLHFDKGDYNEALASFESADPTEDALRGRSAVLRKRGEYDKARRVIDNGLGYLPDSLPLQTERGWILFDEGQYQKSCRAFEKVLDNSAEHREARQGKVASLIRLHEYDEAHRALAAAIRRQPESPVFRVEEGHLLLEQGRPDDARAAFAQAREVSPHDEGAVIGESIALRRLKRPAEALQLLHEELANHGENPALRSELGWVLLDQGDALSSTMAFDQARDSLPANDNAVLGSAIALRRLGRQEEARQRLEQQLQPGVIRGGALEAQLAWVYLESGRWNQATTRFRQLAERDRLYREEARLGMAEVPLRSGDRVQASIAYENLVRDLPGSAIAKVRLAAQLPDLDRDRAKALCLEAIRIDPTLAMAYDCLGVISARAREFEAAESYLRQSLALDSSRPTGLTGLGWFYLQSSRLDEASEVLTGALKSDPADPDANILMGAVHLRRGAIDQADLHFCRALTIRQGDPVAIEGKARAVVAMRNWAQAEEILRDGIEAVRPDQCRDLHLLLARVLIARGDETRTRHFYEMALTEASAVMDNAGRPSRPAWNLRRKPAVTGTRPPAIPAEESGDPWFLAAVASYRMSARGAAQGRAAGAIRRYDSHERQAARYLRTCIEDHNPRHREAKHLQALLAEPHPLSPQAAAQAGIAVVAIALLATLWIAFIQSTRVSENTLVILTPVLVGLLVIVSLLPFIERFKLPGVEADVRSPPADLESPPPLLDVSLGELAAESLSPGADRTTLSTSPQAPGSMRRSSAAISVSALAAKPAVDLGADSRHGGGT